MYDVIEAYIDLVVGRYRTRPSKKNVVEGMSLGMPTLSRAVDISTNGVRA